VKQPMVLRLMAFPAIIINLTIPAHSQPKEQSLRLPEFYSEFTIDQTDNLIKQGYGLVKDSDIDGAIAKFEETRKLVSSKYIPEYHMACAYARNGQEEEALEKLELILSNGFDYPDRLKYDSDLKALRDDPDFETVIERARKNYEIGTAAFAQGMPEYEKTSDEFVTQEELDQWADEQNRLYERHRKIWTATELLTAQVDMQARYLAALKGIKAGDPDFDYGLERIRASVRLKSLARTGWWGVADMVKYEVDAYLRSSPRKNALGNAYFLAGMASSLKYTHNDPRRIDGYDRASEYLEKIKEGNKYYGVGKALMLVNELKSPGVDEAYVGKKLRAVVAEFPGNHDIYTVISTRLGHDAVHLLWPIPLDVADIDGGKVSLDEYRGRVVLIDFWAINCIPCRKELPGMVEVYNKYHNEGFEIISVCLDSADEVTLEALRRWIAMNRMEWRHIFDGRAWDSDLVQRFFVGTVPAAFLVGRDGSVVAWGAACRGGSLAASVQKALE
jgi:thiol-disulfide isomerase/thioredoxin